MPDETVDEWRISRFGMRVVAGVLAAADTAVEHIEAGSVFCRLEWLKPRFGAVVVACGGRMTGDTSFDIDCADWSTMVSACDALMVEVMPRLPSCRGAVCDAPSGFCGDVTR